MGRYNLLDEKWIVVIRENDGNIEKLSLKEVFAHAGEYYDLAGEMKTQDFAVLRVLLAVLQTVFSRFDTEGKPYDMLEIESVRFRQREMVSREELEDEDPFFETWGKLWAKGSFPEIVQDYLEAWRDHFYLFDDTYPFFQVTEGEMQELADGGGQFFGKNLNRTLSESNNKSALFAPIAEGAKDKLHYDELLRWLIMFQGYTGTGDKKKVGDAKQAYSKGWLYDLGGVYLKGKNLFETLLLNCILSTDFDEDVEGEDIRVQIPAWERTPRENVDIYFKSRLDNRASLYTSWSRAVSFPSDFEDAAPFHCFIAKLPEVNHLENFLEPMTCWGWNKTGPNRGKFTPKKHKAEEAVWRHFNVLMGVDREEGEHFRKPGILRWYHKVCESGIAKELEHYKIAICSISMRDDGNATSWAPTDEIVDEIRMETEVLMDENQDGWIEQINTLVNSTKERIDLTLVRFLKELSSIRGLEVKDYHLVNQGREQLYHDIDLSFRGWLYELQKEDSINNKILEWYAILEKAIRNKGNEIYREANWRDLNGINREGKNVNIATAYNTFLRSVHFQFYQVG